MDNSYRTWLRQQGLSERTCFNQVSRVGRIEHHFGDLDVAYAKDRMESLMRRLQYGQADARAGKPLPGGLDFTGDAVKSMADLRSAAKKYAVFKLAAWAMATVVGLPITFEPEKPPRSAIGRSLAPTGYWIFQANPRRWDADAWLTSGDTALTYLVSVDDGPLMQVGDLGVIRRTASPAGPAAVLAIVEVTGAPRSRRDPNPRYFFDRADAGQALRADLEVLARFDVALPVDRLPDTPPFKHLRRGLQRATTAMSQAAFTTAADFAGLTPLEVAAARAARSTAGIQSLEGAMNALDPRRKEIVSHRIERGRIGEAVKLKRGGRCQACEGLGRSPIAFLRRDGTSYAEAHHVVPVSGLTPGSLAATNIMVLCPNHHRQAHFGAFEVVGETCDRWTVRIDGFDCEIEKTFL